MNINELKPGKELDRFIAEEVFGGAWRCWFCCPVCESTHFETVGDTRHCHGCHAKWLPEDALPNYSTSIQDAWEVVGELQKLFSVWKYDSYVWFFIDAPIPNSDEPLKWCVGWKAHIAYEGSALVWYAEGDTVMEAICKAALARANDRDTSTS